MAIGGNFFESVSTNQQSGDQHQTKWGAPWFTGEEIVSENMKIFYTVQGERRFFRTCLHWLADYDRNAVLRNLDQIAEYGRWDDLYALVGTSCEHEALYALGKQLALDYKTKGAISLAGKWAASENASSAKTKRYGRLTAHTMGLTSRQYRVLLSNLRERIRVLERLMSANRWNEIEFDKIPSRAGLIYKNAFARRDLIKAKYEAFAKDTSTKVNAAALYPYDVVSKAIKLMGSDCGWYGRSNHVALDNTDRLMINKYWENLTDYLAGAPLNAVVVADTSGSMCSGANSVAPIDVAVSLALYAAERMRGPFANHYISFSRKARLIETVGVDFCDKVDRIVKTNLCENTNLQSVFDLVLNTAVRNHLHQADMPETIVIISDMEVDGMQGYSSWNGSARGTKGVQTFMDKIRNVWISHGYKLPKLVLWNVNARNSTVLDVGPDVTTVSGCSPVVFEMIMSGKSGMDLMFSKLDSERYKAIH